MLKEFKQNEYLMDLGKQGWFTKRISLDYNARIISPGRFHFECLTDPIYDFRVSNQRLGEDEMLFWKTIVDEKQTALFNGLVSKFYPKYGHLKGHLETLNPKHKIGIKIQNKKAIQIKRYDEILGLV